MRNPSQRRCAEALVAGERRYPSATLIPRATLRFSKQPHRQFGTPAGYDSPSCGRDGEQKEGGGDRRRENFGTRVITAASIRYVPTGVPDGPPRRRPISTQTSTIRLARRAKLSTPRARLSRPSRCRSL